MGTDDRSAPRKPGKPEQSGPNAHVAKPIAFQPDAPVVRRLNRTTVIALTAVVCAVSVIAIADAFRTSRRPAAAAETETNTPAPLPGEVVTRMPASYDGIPKNTPRLGPPRPGEFGTTEVAMQRQGAAAPSSQFGPTGSQADQPDSEEKELTRQRVERMKRAAQAREAGLQFGTGGSAVGGGAGNGEETMRQRLLELQKMQSSSLPVSGDMLPLASLSGGVANAGSVGNTRNVDNRQDDKSEFQGRKRSTDGLLLQALVPAPTGPVIGAGAIIPGVFLTGISSDLPGQITGQVSQNVYDSRTGMHMLIPQGSMLIGEYDAKVAYGQERVLLVWTRLRLPNGASLSLEGMPGVDLSGYAGVTDQVNNHWAKLVGGVVFGSVIGAGAQVAQGGTSVLNPSFSQLAIQGAGQNINQAGQEITRKNLGIQPTLEIRPGMRFNVFVTKDVALPDYQP